VTLRCTSLRLGRARVLATLCLLLLVVPAVVPAGCCLDDGLSAVLAQGQLSLRHCYQNAYCPSNGHFGAGTGAGTIVLAGGLARSLD
jgi:hypothetical protein